MTTRAGWQEGQPNRDPNLKRKPSKWTLLKYWWKRKRK